jgi:hypothetical protein
MKPKRGCDREITADDDSPESAAGTQPRPPGLAALDELAGADVDLDLHGLVPSSGCPEVIGLPSRTAEG